MDQVEKYREFYRNRRWRWAFRFDVRYRCRRLREVLGCLQIDVREKNVLDVGFGSGHLLKCFPKDCSLSGAEISESAVQWAEGDSEFAAWRSTRFYLVTEHAEDGLPTGPFDIILSSHTIEHVPNDRTFLQAIHRRLKPEGLLLLFVPIEEPNYIPQHVRNYGSLAAITTLVESSNFDVLFKEGSMHVSGHIWKVITIPSRRQWPVFKPLVDAFRQVTLSMIPYRGIRFVDNVLDSLGCSPRQGFVIAKKR